MSKKKEQPFHATVITNRPHAAGERLAEEFSKDSKSCRIFKTEKDSQVQLHFKEHIPIQEIAERILKALED